MVSFNEQGLHLIYLLVPGSLCEGDFRFVLTTEVMCHDTCRYFPEEKHSLLKDHDSNQNHFNISTRLRPYVQIVETFLFVGTNFRGLPNFCFFCGDVIWRLTDLLHYNYYARQFITLLNVGGDFNSWVRVTHKIHEHWSPTNNDYSTETVLWKTVH